ncbi:probable enoyl-CoA hydratase [Janibacter sp. HTCC2649]|uniref:enoyl-CoA hydratase-related protein n=1 Tax=Janibacter sp. HTCC2649 TaxID=313589 RepID=UPI0000670C1E|nr:enoyl-CoA hydratase-related protein [Janibacter sp. HTCC2649]EAP99771.1 probable enoyl-CoA hydratase [Janibacter sp. HTCC2649]
MTDTQMYTQIAYDVRDHVATVTLNRLEARNGYTLTMADELADAVKRAGADDDVRVVILTGVGENFCVGADLTSGSLNVTEADGIDEGSNAWIEPATRVTRPLFYLEKPVIAALRGAAVGVGSTMTLPADFRIASTDSRFGFVFSRRGIYPEGGSTWFLPRLVGMGKALDWMISGRLIKADEALASGLVTEVVEPDQVLARAHELAAELVSMTAPVSTAVIRQALYRMSPLASPEAAFDLDSHLIASCSANPDAIEGVMSFLERRTPQFTGKVSRDLPEFLPWQERRASGSSGAGRLEPNE